MECYFETPINLGTEAKPDFEYSVLKCNENFEVLIKDPENPDTKFLLIKEYSYGDITSIFLQGLILFFLIFLLLKKLFFHDTTRIHTLTPKKY